MFGLGTVVLIALCTLTSATTPGTQAHFLTAGLSNLDWVLTADCYPQALPNDGYSQATVSVELSDEDGPIVGEIVRASVVQGDGSFIYDEVETDDYGYATFSLTAGIMPDPLEISFTAETTGETTSLMVPLAPVTYLDVLLLTPAEYAKHLARQVSAAPIYQLSTSVFPEQLAADGGSMSTITAVLTHTADGSPAAGVPMTAELISGNGSLAFGYEIATDTNGEFRFQFIAGMLPGLASIAVIEPSTGLTSAIDILMVQAAPARVELLYTSALSGGPNRGGAILPADGITQLPITARVTDLSGIPLVGIELRLEILDGPNGWIELLDPVTDAVGEIRANYFAGTLVGLVRIRAFISAGL